MKTIASSGNSRGVTKERMRPMSQTRWLSTPAVLIAAFAIGCSPKKDILAERTITPIRPEGGGARSADGRLTLTFAASAFAAVTDVTIRTDRSNESDAYETPIYEIVAGVAPAVPVDLLLDVPDAAPDAELALVNVDGATPEIVATTHHDPKAKTLTAQLAHFSRYRALRLRHACHGRACGDPCVWCDPTEMSCTDPTSPKACSMSGRCIPSGAELTCPNSCPESPPTGGECSSEGQVCNYGQECCCGRCSPSLIATCRQRTWNIAATDFCLGAEIRCPDAGADAGQDSGPGDGGMCPLTMPTSGDACSDSSLHCTYGQECCCGTCGPSFFANCDGAHWAVGYTDFCLRPSCDDAGASDAGQAVPCGPSLTCNRETEVCFEETAFGGLTYSCRAVPPACEQDRSCACLRPSICMQFATCTEPAGKDDTIQCDCPAC
jgi:hypothetical protein